MDSPLLSVRLNLMVAFDKNSNDSSDSFCLDMTWICLFPVYHWLIDWLIEDWLRLKQFSLCLKSCQSKH